MKGRVRSLLYRHAGTFLSGQEISKQLGISRTAVWKHVKSLQQDGYHIMSVPRKGYKLSQQQKLMLPEEIKKTMKTNWLGKSIKYMETVNSTNTWAKEHLPSLTHGTLIIAEEQTQGRGRMGRSWNSVKGEGIWMTLVLRPEIPMTEGAKITQIAAAALHLAVESVAELTAKIKWPNDLLIEGKKVAGILTEMTGELNRIDSLLVGIGINVNQHDFPDDLTHQAVSLYQLKGQEASRIELLNAFLQDFEKLYNDYVMHQRYDKVLDIVRTHSSLLHNCVEIYRGGSRVRGEAIRITDDGLLEVRYEDGTCELLSGGEVSVRPR